MAAPTFTAAQRRLAALRLAAQQIAGSDAATPGEVVRRMLAMQGQDLPGARWSIGLRHAGGTESGVEAAFEAGDIVRSWAMRGTLHVVAGEDLGWLLSLTGRRMIAAAARRRAELGISDGDVARASDLAGRALAGRRTLGRDALLDAFEAGGVSTAGQRGYHLLAVLAQSAILVLGPPDGRQQAFALLEEWVPRRRQLDRDEALGELAVRYIAGHGPATDADLARWSGLPLGEVRRGIAVAGDALATIELGGDRYLVAAGTPPGDATPRLPQSPARPAPPPPRVHLLPGFDEYLLGYRDRSFALAPADADAIVPGGNGMFRATIVVDGVIAGTWGRTVRGRGVEVVPHLFDGRDGPSSAPDAGPAARPSPAVGSTALPVGLAAAVAAYGAFLGRPAQLAPPERE